MPSTSPASNRRLVIRLLHSLDVGMGVVTAAMSSSAFRRPSRQVNIPRNLHSVAMRLPGCQGDPASCDPSARQRFGTFCWEGPAHRNRKSMGEGVRCSPSSGRCETSSLMQRCLRHCCKHGSCVPDGGGSIIPIGRTVRWAVGLRRHRRQSHCRFSSLQYVD